jgi:hypothetical protein
MEPRGTLWRKFDSPRFGQFAASVGGASEPQVLQDFAQGIGVPGRTVKHFRQSIMDPPGREQAKWKCMKIGIIGSGNMGRALGLRWAQNGHDVLFGSRDHEKAEKIAAQGGQRARAGSLDEAAASGEVILYTVRDVPPSSLLNNARALTGKIVVDCNNSDMPADFRFATPVPSLAEKLACGHSLRPNR